MLATSALGALALSGATAGSAQADDLQLEFDSAVINLGSLSGGQLIDPATDPPATQDGEIDTATGDFTVQPADFFIPEKTFEDVQPGIDAHVAMSIDEPATGNLDTETGALTESLGLTAVVDVISSGSTLATCTVADIPLTFETTGTLPGDPTGFDAAPFAPPTGEGAVVELWDDIPASTANPGGEVICGIVDGTIGGPGGIWESGTATVGGGGEPGLDVSVDPKKDKVKQGESAEFMVIAENAGESIADGVEACAKAPKAVKIKGDDCTDVDDIPGGESRDASFKFKTKKSTKPKEYTLKFTVSADGLEDQKAEATLKVKRR